MNSTLRGLVASVAMSSFLGTGSASAADWLHFLEQGDTLWGLCERHTDRRLCYIELQAYNEIKNDRRIPVDTLIRIPAGWLREPLQVGEVLARDGQTVHRNLEGTLFTQLLEGQSLYLGDGIKTGDGVVILSLISGASIMLRPDSMLVLESFSTLVDFPLVEILLDYGSAEAAVEYAEEDIPDEPPAELIEELVSNSARSDFQIATAAASTSVRGTARISSEQENRSMRGEVVSGSMDVSAGNTTTSVAAGYGIRTELGQAPGQPSQLLAGPALADDYSAVVKPATVAWQADESAASWQLDLLGASGIGLPLQSMRLSEPTHIFDELDQGCYTLALRAIHTDGLHGLESRAPLCIVPDAPVLAELLEKSRSAEESLVARWNGVDGATRYHVQVAADRAFHDITGTWITESAVQDLPIGDVDGFFVRVRAINDEGLTSAFSEPVEYRKDEADWMGAFLAIIVAAIVGL